MLQKQQAILRALNGSNPMDEILERLKEQLEIKCDDEKVMVDRLDLMKLIQEYEIETDRKKKWLDERR